MDPRREGARAAVVTAGVRGPRTTWAVGRWRLATTAIVSLVFSFVFGAIALAHLQSSGDPSAPTLEALERQLSVFEGSDAERRTLETRYRTIVLQHIEEAKSADDFERLGRVVVRSAPHFRVRVEVPVLLAAYWAELARRKQDWTMTERGLEHGASWRNEVDERARDRESFAHNSIGLDFVEVNLWFDRGLPDRAEEPLERARESLERAWVRLDDERRAKSRMRSQWADLSKYELQLLMLLERYDAVLSRVDRWLTSPPPGLEDPASQAKLLRKRGQAYSHLFRRGLANESDALEALNRVVDTAEASWLERFPAAIGVVQLAVQSGRWDEARAMIERAEALLENPDRDPLQSLMLEAMRARIALGTDASGASLQRSVEEIDRKLAEYWVRWDRDASRRGGGGLLISGRLLSAMTVRVELARRLEGSAEAFDVGVDLVNQAQRRSWLSEHLELSEPTKSELAHVLPDGWGLIFFLPSVDGTLVLALDREATLVVTTEQRSRLEYHRQELLEALLQSPREVLPIDRAARRSAIDRHARALGRFLLPPEVRERVAGWRGIRVCGSDLLGYLPFEALRVPELGDDGIELGLVKPIDYWPSLALGVTLANRTEGSGVADGGVGRLVQLTDVTPSDPVRTRYPEAARWSPGVVPELERFEFTRLTDADATLATLERELAAGADLLQLLVHGVHDRRREVSPALVISADPSHEDGLLRASHLERLPLPPVVLLTACGSGRGVRRWGDPGATDLSGAAFVGGARVVIAPYARLELESARELSQKLYRGLEQGDSVAVALWSARKELAEQPDSDPFYYALLHVHGNGGESVLPSPPRSSFDLISWLVMATLALGIGWKVFRRRKRA